MEDYDWFIRYFEGSLLAVKKLIVEKLGLPCQWNAVYILTELSNLYFGLVGPL